MGVSIEEKQTVQLRYHWGLNEHMMQELSILSVSLSVFFFTSKETVTESKDI